ncbi:ROK family protein [Sporosarcina sp. Marseille-Q4063]|uniref:ROK family protein n=1 Tax=Sporosarcina sp. Marseille-Q4063 TaxID=2810514 RepID=UPI001BAE7D82|nr:ROK family protein [Sporosarcina sp. Marseille-Q4063]QUW21502.1 ROK family protein [Sporosarcina sp. Marseille-Q4063]
MGKANKKYFMGVDVGGTKIWICITDSTGNIFYKKKTSTSNNLNSIYNIISNCLTEARITIKELSFISFGIPGTTNSKTGVVLDAPALKWIDVPFKMEMELRLPIPVFINNDVNCAALGEQWLGIAKNVQNFVFIAIGTGVGGAIVTNGKLVQGEHFMAGEIGYFLLEEDVMRHSDSAKTKGQFGLFENKTSGTALANHGVDPKHLFLQYQKGDSQATIIIDEFINHFSIGISNVVSLLNPKKVILGGGVAQSLEDIIPIIESNIAKHLPIPISIEVSRLGELSGAIGAIAFGMEEQKSSTGLIGKKVY